MEAQNQTTPLLDTAKKVLLEFAPNVSKDDKKEAAESTSLTLTTIIRYLNGDVRDIGTAEKIIEFLRPRVEKRISTITNSEAPANRA